MHPNDIPVLAKIFNPNTKYIFIPQSGFPNGSITDALNCHLFFYESPLFIKEVLEKYPAKHCTVINPLPDHFFSKEITTIQVEPPSHPVTSRHWMNFAQSINSSSDRKSLYEKAYHYINNPDDTIRWLYPAIQKQPTFLHLYNASGWKGKLIKKGIEVGFRWGLEERIKQGTIQVYAPYALVGGVLQKASTLFKPTDFAIFTGTKGENRKAVIVFEKNKRATHFLKAPLTAAAENLVKNEGDQLKQLANYSFDTLVVPQAKRIHQHLLQTNIRPTTFRPNLNLTTTHLQALWELYQETVEWKLLEQTTAWTTLEDNLSKLIQPYLYP